jgi:hypothetical protein
MKGDPKGKTPVLYLFWVFFSSYLLVPTALDFFTFYLVRILNSKLLIQIAICPGIDNSSTNFIFDGIVHGFLLRFCAHFCYVV